MRNKAKFLTYGAVLAAAYVALTHLQNVLLPGTASNMIQVRIAEALCVFAFFTPAGIYGTALGCLLFNLTSGAGLPLDLIIGTTATVLATTGMWLSRKVTVKGLPLLGLLLPAVANGLLVGWELEIYIGGGFWFNAVCVALGELGVLLLPGTLLYYTMKKIGPHRLMLE
jgi:uncharacterized membrane protein